MGSLVVEPGFFNSERDVVKEELRSRVLAAPYGRLFYLYLPQISYDVHPYAPARHRQHRGSRRGDDRRRARLPRHLLPARQCGAGRRRQFRPGPARPLGRPLFRRRSRGPPARSRGSPRSSRSAPRRAPLHRLRGEHAAAGGADLLSGAAGERRATRRRWRCSTASFRPARARGSTRAWSIATGSPPRPARSSTSSRAAAASPSMRSSPSGQTAEAGEAALRREIARFRDAPVTRGRARRGEERTADRRAARARDRRRPRLGARRGGDRRRRRRAPPTAGSPQIAAVTPADIQRVARRWLRDEAQRRRPLSARGERRTARARTRSRPPRPSQTAALAAPADIRIVAAGARGRARRAAARRGPRSSRRCRRRTSSGSPTASP